MRQSLDAIASLLTNGECDLDTLNWASLRYQHTAAVQAVLVEKHSPATAKKMMCALKRVLREARKLGLMDAESYAIAVELPSIQSSKKLRGRALSQQEITALMDVCTLDPTPQGTRDAALIAILRGAGLRRAEVVKLELKDFNANTSGLEVRGGKGDQDRTVYLPDDAIASVSHPQRGRD
jgi:site-specific recombinase XerD